MLGGEEQREALGPTVMLGRGSPEVLLATGDARSRGSTVVLDPGQFVRDPEVLTRSSHPSGASGVSAAQPVQEQGLGQAGRGEIG